MDELKKLSGLYEEGIIDIVQYAEAVSAAIKQDPEVAKQLAATLNKK